LPRYSGTSAWRNASFVVVGEQAVECEVPDLEELGDVIDQGFDPHAPGGPTYWRITASGIYYSTMLTVKGIVLSITKPSRGSGGPADA